MSTGTDISTRTVAGLLAYCDWLRAKHYQSPNAIEAWKTAVKKVFQTVEPDAYESISLEQLDLDDYVRRFRTAAGAQYKAETVAVYERRIVNAIEAQEYYIANGKPPVFRKGAGRTKDGEESQAVTPVRPRQQQKQKQTQRPLALAPDRYEFNYPLGAGMAHVSVPMPLTRRDIERLSTVLATLEEQPQLPQHAGGEALAA